MATRVDLDDLATASDLAAEFGVSAAAVCNWAAVSATFPAPLRRIGSANVYSRRAVVKWRKATPRPFAAVSA